MKEVGVCPIEHLSNSQSKEEDTEEEKEQIFGQNRISNSGTAVLTVNLSLEFPGLSYVSACSVSYSALPFQWSDIHEMSEINEIIEADEMHEKHAMTEKKGTVWCELMDEMNE